MRRPRFLISFARSQIASVFATFTDFGVLFLFVEGFGVYYVVATAIGAFSGAVVHFLLGRFWAFIAIEGNPYFQIFKYALVAAGSLILNSAGVYLMTSFGGIPYGISKLITATIVGLSYNFLLHRYFVFHNAGPDNKRSSAFSS